MTDSRKRAPHILCISPLIAPIADAEAFCGAKMVQGLIQSGASVAVISSNDIRRGSLIDSSCLWSSLRDVVFDVPQVSDRNTLHSLGAACRFQIPFFARWISNAVQAAQRLHRARNFDFVYSRSLPMIAHVAGFWCARKLKLPWVANINDPWEFNFFPGHSFQASGGFFSRAYVFWLRRTLMNADLVTYPCKGLQKFHRDLSKLEHSAKIIPHIGYRPQNAPVHSLAGFRIVHAGKLGVNEVTRRSARAVLLGLRHFLDDTPAALRDTMLVFVGPADKETQLLVGELGLGANVEHVGRVSYEDSIKHIQSASVCLLIETDIQESIFFPSKLADYIVCGKPVLAVSPPVGLSADLANSGEILRVGHDSQAVKKALGTLYAAYKQGTLNSWKPTDEMIHQLEGSAVVQGFLSACEPLLNGTL